MIADTNKIFIYFFTALFLVAAGFFAYFQQIYFLVIPFGLLLSIYLIQNPAHLFYLLLISIPWSIEFNFTPTLGTDLPDEPLMLLAALASVILIIVYRNRLSKSNFHPLVFLLVLQFLWTIITVGTSTEMILSTKHALAKSWYLLAFVAVPLFLFKDEKILKRSFVLLLASMMIFMFVALIRHSQNDWTFEKINDSLAPFYRNHVNYSALLVFMVPIQIAVINLSSSRNIKFVVKCTLAVTIVALYFSYSRGAWLALIAGFFAYWLIRKRLLLFGYFLFLVVCIVGILWLKSNDRYLQFSPDYESTIFHTDFREHLVATYQMKDVSTAERFHRWVAGVRMTGDSWKTGLGPSTFYKHYKSYTQPAFKTWVSKNEEKSTVHNYFLLMIIEQGVIGLLLFLVLLGLLFWYAQKIYHRTADKFWKISIAAVASILIMQCTVNSLSDLIETDKIGSVFYLCIAVIIIADIKTKKEISDPATDI